jgi:hypothetical protein
MATSSVILDIRANTQRALSEFKSFSSQLDNKFLISGLKLDVVRNALSQINREFQKSLGEQGLTSAQSLKAAENQVAVLTNLFSGFSKTASGQITEDFSKALNQVAIRTGATVNDIQRTLRTAPFLSRSLSQGQREGILEQIQSLQLSTRRAGLGNAADVISQFAAGQTTGADLLQSPDALKNLLGVEISKAGGFGQVQSVEARTQILQKVLSNIDLEKLAEETGGFKAVLEQFSASLFNPRAGLFGALKEFTLGINEGRTTIFKETTELFKSIFGPEGFIKTLGKELAKAFGLSGDDTSFVKFLGRGIRFLTNLIKNVTNLIDDIFNNPIVKGIVEITRRAFDGIVGFFRQLDDIAKNPPDLSVVSVGNITDGIKQIGEGIRGFLKKIGDTIRGTDISETSESGTSILNTIIDEAGKTLITFFREVGGALLSKVGTITADLATKLPGTILGLFTRLFSEGGPIGIIIGSVIAARTGASVLRGVGSARQAFAGQGGPLGALNRSLNRPFGPLRQKDGALASELGTSQTFHRQVIYYLSRIANCVCGNFGRGGRDIDIDADTPEARRERARTRRGPAGPGMPRRTPLTSLDTANPYAYSRGAYLPEPDTRASYLKARRESRRNYVRGLGSSQYFDLYAESLGGVSGPFAGESADQRALRASRSLEGDDDIKYQERLRQRYNRRFSRRARIGRGIRGFGKGALIAGGVAALGGLMLGGGGAQAAEIDPMTGEPIPQKMGAGQAFGNIGMGALEGASTGAMIGSIIPGVGTGVGAAIGGALGGLSALLDKGTRDAAGEFIKGLLKSATDFGRDLLKGAQNAVSGIFDFVKNVDWKGILIRALIPGGDFTIKGLESLGEFASKLNVFDAIKDGINNIASPVKNLWDTISGWKPPWAGNFEGLNYYGPSMAKEMQMSGGSPLLVNDREFVIPRDGFPILADAVERRISSSRGGGDVSMSPTFNITINATGLAGNDIAAAIRPAVIDVIDAAWTQASGNIVTRGSTLI